MEPKISAIIVNYATKGLIKLCVDNLLKSPDIKEVIFIDNDSPDGSYDEAVDLYAGEPRVKIMQNKNNGLSNGHNIGIRNSTGEIELYIGTDAFPTVEALSQIVKYMDENPKAGAVTPKLFLRNGKVDVDAHRYLPTPWIALTKMTGLSKIFSKSKFFNGYFGDQSKLSQIDEIDCGISHFLAVRRSAQKKIGLWDESYFLFGEDIDFCYRIKQAGYKVMYLGNVEVLHYKGASVGRDTAKDIENAMNKNFEYVSFKGEVQKKNTSKWIKRKIARESTRAMRHFYIKHLAKRYPVVLNKIVLFGIWVNEKMREVRVFLG